MREINVKTFAHLLAYNPLHLQSILFLNLSQNKLLMVSAESDCTFRVKKAL